MKLFVLIRQRDDSVSFIGCIEKQSYEHLCVRT
jgi:hypothetical protein